MIKPIVLYGDKILRKPTDYIREGSDIKSLIQDLWDTMYNADGAGLAAPQIGVSMRVFVADLPDQEWKQVFINPVINEKYGERETVIEGCLSLPTISAHIIREELDTLKQATYHQPALHSVCAQLNQQPGYILSE